MSRHVNISDLASRVHDYCDITQKSIKSKFYKCNLTKIRSMKNKYKNNSLKYINKIIKILISTEFKIRIFNKFIIFNKFVNVLARFKFK